MHELSNGGKLIKMKKILKLFHPSSICSRVTFFNIDEQKKVRTQNTSKYIEKFMTELPASRKDMAAKACSTLKRQATAARDTGLV